MKWFLTAAQVRALIAVRDGKVNHRFHANGNTYERPPESAAIMFHRLESAGLIEDEKTPGRFPTTFRVRLTEAGREALEDNRLFEVSMLRGRGK